MTPTNIVYALVDSSDWMQGVELRLCASTADHLCTGMRALVIVCASKQG